MDSLHTTFPPYLPQKGEEYMNPKQRSHFKKVLKALKKELSRDIDRTVRTMQNETTIARIDAGDHGYCWRFGQPGMCG